MPGESRTTVGGAGLRMKLASVSSVRDEKIQKEVSAKTTMLLDVRAETCPRIYVTPRTQSRKKNSNVSQEVRRYVRDGNGRCMMHVRTRGHSNRRLNDTSVNDTEEVRSRTYRDVPTRSDGSGKS